MSELIWSFVDGMESTEGGGSFRLVYQPDVLQKIGYPPDTSLVPESLLIEGAAQASGLTLFLEDPAFHSLPVLARVNRGEFFLPAGINQEFRVHPVLTQLSDAGAIFECDCSEEVSENIVGRFEILLGFVPFDQLPNGGAEARNRLNTFIRSLRH